MVNHFLVLGLEDSASDLAIEESYRYLTRKLAPASFESDSLGKRQAEIALSCVIRSYDVLKDPDQRRQHRQQVEADRARGEDENLRPMLGHICVAAGYITLEDLMDAVSRQADIDLPLGQILQEMRLLSQTELEGMLMGQRFFADGPPRPIDQITRRLLHMELVTRDMVKIVLFDQRTSMCTLGELLVQRSWLDKDILDILVGQSQQRTAI